MSWFRNSLFKSLLSGKMTLKNIYVSNTIESITLSEPIEDSGLYVIEYEIAKLYGSHLEKVVKSELFIGKTAQFAYLENVYNSTDDSTQYGGFYLNFTVGMSTVSLFNVPDVDSYLLNKILGIYKVV